MTDRSVQLLFYALMLMLSLSALIVRRPQFGTTLRMALAWAGIFAVGLLIVSQGERLPFWRTLLDGQSVAGAETRVGQADDGHFWATAELNGVRRRMLVDSGATTTALSADTAHAIGLDVEESRFPVLIETANGTVQARTTTVRKLMLGSITATDLPVVVSPAFGTTDVLGMNFLSRLASWKVEGRTLILTPKNKSKFT